MTCREKLHFSFLPYTETNSLWDLWWANSLKIIFHGMIPFCNVNYVYFGDIYETGINFYKPMRVGDWYHF